jgi:transaldolase
MQLYLDSANMNEIKTICDYGLINGITTNPSLLAKEDPSLSIQELILSIYKTIGGHVSVEVNSTDTVGMLKEAEEILTWFPEATIKIPMIPNGLAAVKELSRQDIPTNVTLIFTAMQALAANNAGASYVSVFLGRLDDIGTDGMIAVRETCEIWDRHGLESQIIAASIRHPIHILECAKAGADIATVPYKVLTQILKHPLTDSGLAAFINDHNKMLAAKVK